MLVISHTPKRTLTDPLTENSLSGSKRIANFADSIFAIGKSIIDDNIRYIKQIKSRSGEIIYGASNVQAYYIDHQDGLLRFIHIGEGSEREHLKHEKDRRANNHDDIKQMLANGKTTREIIWLVLNKRYKINTYYQDKINNFLVTHNGASSIVCYFFICFNFSFRLSMHLFGG